MNQPQTANVDTSIESLEILEKSGKGRKYRKQAHAIVLKNNERGMTSEEIEENLHIKQVTTSGVVDFLKKADLLYDCGERRISKSNRKVIVLKARRYPRPSKTTTKCCTKCKGTGEIREVVYFEGQGELL